MKFLKLWKQRVVPNGQHLSWTNVLPGVPQGSILSRLLLFVCFNNLSDGLQCNSKVFPDDTSSFPMLIFFYQKISRCFNDFQNQNFSVLWLKWTQKMEMKHNHTFFLNICSNLTSYRFCSKLLKYFHDFQKQNFYVLWLEWTQTIKRKQNQAFFQRYIFKPDIIFNWSQNIKKVQWLLHWNVSILFQKWAQTSENQTVYVQIWQYTICTRYK